MSSDWAELFGHFFLHQPTYTALLAWACMTQRSRRPQKRSRLQLRSRPRKRSRSLSVGKEAVDSNRIGGAAWLLLARMLHDDDERPLLLRIFSHPPGSWGSSAPIEEFKGVELKGGRVSEISGQRSPSGSATLCRLPTGLLELNLWWCGLCGPLDLTSLPAGLQKLHLKGNNY